MATKLDIKIKSLNVSGAWKYDFPQNTNDSCQICRKHIMAPSYDDIQKKETISKISIGKCGHAYHSSCINKFCKTNVSCPIDYTPWELSKELESTKLFFRPKGNIEKELQNSDSNKNIKIVAVENKNINDIQQSKVPIIVNKNLSISLGSMAPPKINTGV